MVNLYFVRHGEASSSWDVSSDPGLSDLGWRQAETVADQISKLTKPISIYSSPLQRAKDTSSPLIDKWREKVVIRPEISEIPSGDISMNDRREWLNQLMVSEWSSQPQHLLNWRAGILNTLKNNSEDAVFFTHFMVLNVIVGAIENSENIVSYRPDNCAILRVSLENGTPILLDKGSEAVTVVR